MNNLERIKQFTPKEKNIGAEIKYLDIMEICQGGPEVGNISINGKKISGIYGVSILYQKEYIFIPIYVQKIWGTGFRVAKINIQTLEVEVLGKTHDVIVFDKIDDNRVYFFIDMQRKIQKYYEI